MGTRERRGGEGGGWCVVSYATRDFAYIFAAFKRYFTAGPFRVTTSQHNGVLLDPQPFHFRR